MEVLDFRIAKQWEPDYPRREEVALTRIPRNLLELCQASDHDDWKDLMVGKLTKMFESKVLIPVKKPEDFDSKQLIPLPWVFDKTSDTRTANTPVCDDITFPVGPAKSTLSFLLNLACQHKWHVEQTSLNDALLDGDIYIKPDQFTRGVIEIDSGEEYILKMNRQSDNFFLSFYQFVTCRLGFEVSSQDPHVFFKFKEDGKLDCRPTILVLHGRDCIVINYSDERTQKYKQLITDRFPGGKETGLVIDRNVKRRFVQIDTSKQAEEILQLWKTSKPDMDLISAKLEQLTCLRQDLDLRKPIKEVMDRLAKTKDYLIKYLKKQNRYHRKPRIHAVCQTEMGFTLKYARNGFCWRFPPVVASANPAFATMFKCVEYTVHFRTLLKEIKLMSERPEKGGRLPRYEKELPNFIEIDDWDVFTQVNANNFAWRIPEPIGKAQWLYITEQISYRRVYMPDVNHWRDSNSAFKDPNAVPAEFQTLFCLYDLDTLDEAEKRLQKKKEKAVIWFKQSKKEREEATKRLKKEKYRRHLRHQGIVKKRKLDDSEDESNRCAS